MDSHQGHLPRRSKHDQDGQMPESQPPHPPPPLLSNRRYLHEPPRDDNKLMAQIQHLKSENQRLKDLVQAKEHRLEVLAESAEDKARQVRNLSKLLKRNTRFSHRRLMKIDSDIYKVLVEERKKHTAELGTIDRIQTVILSSLEKEVERVRAVDEELESDEMGEEVPITMGVKAI